MVLPSDPRLCQSPAEAGVVVVRLYAEEQQKTVVWEQNPLGFG